MSILFTEEPLVLNVALACEIGVNEAIVLQQVDYWIKGNKKRKHNFKNGYYWTYNTYENWQEENFPFWSVSTVKRTFRNLEKKGLLLSSTKMNKMLSDRTKWYTINYEAVDNLGKSAENPRPIASDQIDPTIGSNWSNGSDQIDPLLPESSSESSSEIDDDELYIKLAKMPNYFLLKKSLSQNGFSSSNIKKIIIKLFYSSISSELTENFIDTVLESFCEYSAHNKISSISSYFVSLVEKEVAVSVAGKKNKMKKLEEYNARQSEAADRPAYPGYNWLEE